MIQNSPAADSYLEQKRIYQPKLNEILRLNLGCGKSRMEGFVNCDCAPSDNTDLIFDLHERWPFRKESVSEIYCSHTLEHLTNHMHFFNEAWRVLKPKGQMVIRVPYGNSRPAMSDMTHVRPWYIESFACLQPGYNVGTLGNHYDEHKACFWVIDGVITVHKEWYKISKIPFIGKKILNWGADHLMDVGRELWAVLEKANANDVVEGRSPIHVPFVYAVWEAELEGREIKPGIISGLRRFG